MNMKEFKMPTHKRMDVRRIPTIVHNSGKKWIRASHISKDSHKHKVSLKKHVAEKYIKYYAHLHKFKICKYYII